MSAGCHSHGHDHGAAAAASPAYRRILWVALAVNLAMFIVEIGAGVAAQSAALLADSLDFLGDAAHRFQVIRGCGGETGFHHVHAETSKPTGDLEFFVRGQGCSGGLFAIS